MVEHTQRLGCRQSLKSPGEVVGPTVVSVCRRASAVRDGIAQRYDSRRLRGGRHVHAGNLKPVIDLLGIQQVDCGNLIAVHDKGRRARTGVTGLYVRRCLQIYRDRQIIECCNGIGDRIGNKFRTGGYCHIGASGEGQCPIGRDVDTSGRTGKRFCDVGRRDVQRNSAEDI